MRSICVILPLFDFVFRAGMRSICVILPLFGVTWVLGVFSVNEDLVVFQYLFAIFNSLQVSQSRKLNR